MVGHSETGIVDDYVGLPEDRRREAARRATKAHQNRCADLQSYRAGSPAGVSRRRQSKPLPCLRPLNGHRSSKYFLTELTPSVSSHYGHSASPPTPVSHRSHAIVWLEIRSDMTDYGLDDKQAIVIAAFIAGYTPAKAAEARRRSPVEIDFWRRNSLPFQKALMDAHYSLALQFREKALALADRAFKTPSDILDDPEASPSVRLKAATFIIQTAIAPPFL